MATKKYYAFCEDDCKYETLTKEQTLAAIMQAVSTGEIQDIDTGFVTNVNVSVDTSTHTYSADKTFEEIYAALQAGRFVFVTYGGSCFFVDMTNAAKIIFVRHFVDSDSGEVLANKLSVTSNNVWSMTTDAVTASGDTGAVYVNVSSTDGVISTVNGETFTDILALINGNRLVVVRYDYMDFYYTNKFEFSDTSGNHTRLNFVCNENGKYIYTITLKEDSTWTIALTSLQKSETVFNGQYDESTDTLTMNESDIYTKIKTALENDSQVFVKIGADKLQLVTEGTDYFSFSACTGYCSSVSNGGTVSLNITMVTIYSDQTAHCIVHNIYDI
ncbi:MAG: hypothetical protein ACI4DY_13375 [Monoglobaceae bacterium]